MTENIPYLSVLVCTVPPRKQHLNRLLSIFQNMINKDPSLQEKVEIIVYNDNFENTVGDKRTRLTQEAKGLFSCFVDDDDVPMDNYLSRFCSIIDEHHINKPENEKIDHIGFVLAYIEPGKNPIPAFHSIVFNGWFNDRILYTLPEFEIKEWYTTPDAPCRHTTHLNPIRTDISKKYPFPKNSRGEDMERSLKIMVDNVLKKEVIIDDVMYIYFFDVNKTLTQVENRDVAIKNQKLEWTDKPITMTCVRYL